MSENKYQENETEGYDVTSGNVGKETDHKHERLGEHTYKFYQRHDGKRDFQPPRHAWGVENVFPIVFVARESGDKECYNSQNSGDGDVASNIYSAREKWNKA